MTTLCSDWITGDDVAACCAGVEVTGPVAFDDVAAAASELLFELSGRQFVGVCTTTDRPCSNTCGCPWQILSRGYVIWNPMGIEPWWGWWCDGNPCGCGALSRVMLSGGAISVSEVKIDGDVVDPDTYRLDERLWLTRTRPSADDDPNMWPACQALDLPDDQPGTFSVTYTYGEEVPAAGIAAAAELACQLYKACAGVECQLPAGTTRVARTGVVIERPAFLSWGWQKGGRTIPKGWNTGMPTVDLFLNAYNPGGLQREPVFWAPGRPRFAEHVGP